MKHHFIKETGTKPNAVIPVVWKKHKT
jgi:hypothetical protein